MRTTIRLDEHLLSEVKDIANKNGQTMTAVIEEALRLLMAQRKQLTKQTPIQLITVSGHGLQAGVDLDDSATLLELMENTDDPT